jgi:uncharacterized protein YggU (UPF0235/DUF167 family)
MSPETFPLHGDRYSKRDNRTSVLATKSAEISIRITVTLRAKKEYRSESWSRFVRKSNIDQNHGHASCEKGISIRTMVTLRAKKEYRSESWSRFVPKSNIDQNHGHASCQKAISIRIMVTLRAKRQY